MCNKAVVLFALLCPISGFCQVYEDVAIDIGIIHSTGPDGTYGGGVSFVDFDDDGYDDLTFSSQEFDSLYFFKNNGGAFNRVYLDGVENTCQSKQVTWVDIDNDGDKDFHVACHGAPNGLYENLGDMVFRDISVSAGLDQTPEKTFGTSFGDIDLDGFLDMIVMNRSYEAENNYFLYLNNGDNTFTDITQSAGINIGKQLPFCAAFIDYNKDGYPDIYIALDALMGNVLLHNNGDRTFTDMSTASGMGVHMDAMCVTPGDYNNDGDIDIYLTDIPTEGNQLLSAIGDGTYKESTDDADVAINGWDWGANFLDVDNDSDLDLYVSGEYTMSDPNNSHLFINTGLNSFQPSSPALQCAEYKSYGNAVGDFNNDGFADIAINNGQGTPSQLLKNTQIENNWVKVFLEGTISSRDGTGSKIEVFTGDLTQTRYTYCGESFVSQNAMHENFGLRDLTEVDSIAVTWLSGIRDVLYDIEANRNVLVTEGMNPVPLPVFSRENTFDFSYFYSDPGGTINFTIVDDLNASSEPFSIDIMQTDGRIIKESNWASKIENEIITIDLSNYPAGIHFMQVRSGQQLASHSFYKY